MAEESQIAGDVAVSVAPVVDAQAFFAALYKESRKSGFGDQAKGWTRNLLIRAEEAGLYTPPKDP